ncbi:MAG: hypothetical protein EXS63_00105 [Candidatus Omnitrophica bacterium]|nr:hypothetical protein [Candidatus Omnitrophota bacterium]
MSLRFIHLVFIVTVIGLFLLCAGLSYRAYQVTAQLNELALTGGSLLLAGIFCYYFSYVLKVLRKIPTHES